MFVGHGPSGLPEDRVVNTYHFQGGGTYAEDAFRYAIAVAQFYTDPRATSSIGAWLSPWIQRSAEVVTYDLTTAKPRVPTVLPITLEGGASSGLPEEVAICVSWYSDPPVTKRTRGRNYIGPLGVAAVTQSSSTTPARPNPLFVADLLDAARDLMEIDTIESLFGLQIKSSVGLATNTRVRHAYVDNALDTQRRRGPETTARTQAYLADA